MVKAGWRIQGDPCLQSGPRHTAVRALACPAWAPPESRSAIDRYMRIIDVGCGAGLVTEPISRLGAAVIGIDAAERNVLVAARHARSTGAAVAYRHALPEELADQAGAFDAVLSLEGAGLISKLLRQGMAV